MLARQAKAAGIPVFLAYFFMPGGKFFTHWLYGFTMVNPIDVIPRVNCPILFVHEQYDEFTSSEETRRLLRAADNPADEIWEASATEHSQAFRTHPIDFVNKIDEFISSRVTGISGE
jgi:pimeloyl-ACP methyl ester carboxylesterase